MDTLLTILTIVVIYLGYQVFTKDGLTVKINGKEHNITIYDDSDKGE